MKKSLLVLLFCFTILLKNLIAQSCIYPGGTCPNSTYNGLDRALYVDDFLRMKTNDLNVEKSVSILGETADETTLLDYAQSQNVKLIYLYNMYDVFSRINEHYDFDNANPTYMQLLASFITTAKTQYNISVGAVIGSKSMTRVIYQWNGDRDFWKCMPAVKDPTPSLNAIRQEIDMIPEGQYSPYLESIYELLSVYKFNNFFNGESFQMDQIATCSNNTTFDRVITEYEFWTQTVYDPACPCDIPNYAANSNDYIGNYKEILSYAGCLRDKSICPMKVDTYLGWLNNDNEPDLDQAKFIDQICDRVYLHSYQCDVSQLFRVFKRPSVSSRVAHFGDPSTKPNTELWPIFSGEDFTWVSDPLHQLMNKDSYLGPFLSDPSSTLNPNGGFLWSCAENIFQDTYLNDPLHALDNQVQGTLWFSYFLLHHNPSSHVTLRKAGKNTGDDELIDVLNWGNGKFEINTYESIQSYDVIDSQGKLVTSGSGLLYNVQLDLSVYEKGIFLFSV